MGKKVEFEQFDPQKGIFEGYIGWGLLQQQPLGTNRVSQARMFILDLLLRIAYMLRSRIHSLTLFVPRGFQVFSYSWRNYADFFVHDRVTLIH